MTYTQAQIDKANAVDLEKLMEVGTISKATMLKIQSITKTCNYYRN